MHQIYLDESLNKLKLHFNDFYLSSNPMPLPTTQGTSQKGAKHFDFYNRYRKAMPQFRDEIKEFINIPREAWDGCDPIQWWAARRHQFPNLSRLARDIFSIPGR
jgi:hypothetical protein